MSVVRINAITVPADRVEEFERRFAARAGEVSKAAGFETFELMRPTDGRDVYLVYTRWSSEDDFQAWVNSPAFQHGHKAHSSSGPVGTASELWSFDVIQHEDTPAGTPRRAMTVDRVTAHADPVLAELTGAGGAFEIVTEDVLGVPLQVYKNRLHSLGDLIAMADGRAGVDFLVQGDRRLTFDEHNALVRRVAASLVELGVGHGDRVAILSANNVEWVVLWWAAAAIGAVVVPLNAWWKTEELEFGLRDSGANLLFCDPKRWDSVRDRVEQLPDLEHVFVNDLDQPDGRARPGAELLGDDRGALPDAGVDEDDLFAILYTSGTTGKPKGATLTHRQALANLQNIFCLGVANASRGGDAAPELSSNVQSAALLVVPLFHVTGCLSTMMLCYASGAKLVLMPPGRFDPDATMATIEREKVTSFGGVPTIMWRIVEAPTFDDYDLSTVQRVSYGGAPAAPELVQRIHERFPKVRKTLATAYGLTETASVATSNAGDDYGSHPDSVGRPAPTVEIEVVDPDLAAVPTGATGEIALRGPTIMRRGYWNRPDATAGAITPEGWFRSGDIGRFDEDGFLYLVDRAKDMIIRGGENVYCVEVEQELFEHPDVIDAAVVGVPHKVLGEEVKAVVQLKPASTLTVEELRAHCAARLANFKVPEYIELRDEPLPRNPAGKVLKNLLRGDESAALTSFSADPADDSGALTSGSRPREPAIETFLLDTHNVVGFGAVIANGIAGIVCLVVWRVMRWRGRWVWILTIAAEALFMFDVIVGTILVAGFKLKAPNVHYFYGFLVFLTVGLAFQYRDAMRGRTELLYGLVGLFLMGLGIRAVFQVV